MGSSSAPGGRQGGGFLSGLARRLGIAGADDHVAVALYASCVAQARRPTAYAAWGVPDDAPGRFEMVILHCLMVSRALSAQGERGGRLAQARADRLFADMEPSLRELGVSDVSIGRQLLKLAETYMARARDMDSLWTADPEDSKLQGLLARNVYAERSVASERSRALARYLGVQAAHVASLPGETVLQGNVVWLEPDATQANVVDPARAGA